LPKDWYASSEIRSLGDTRAAFSTAAIVDRSANWKTVRSKVVAKIV
jgi:hypothetical protein